MRPSNQQTKPKYLEALPVDNGWTGFIILSFRYPHLQQTQKFNYATNKCLYTPVHKQESKHACDLHWNQSHEKQMDC